MMLPTANTYYVKMPFPMKEMGSRIQWSARAARHDALDVAARARHFVERAAHARR